MRLHVLSARRLSDELAAGRVTPRAQAAYIAVTSVVWLLPYYFGIVVGRASLDGGFAFGMYWMEFAMLVVINVAGAFHCLRQCRVAPERHFVIDFTCLYAPVAIVVLAATWGAFHAAIWILPRAMASIDNYRMAEYLTLRGHDVLLYLTIVGQLFLMYALVAHYMRRTSALRA